MENLVVFSLILKFASNTLPQFQNFTVKLLVELRGRRANKEIIILISLKRFEQNHKKLKHSYLKIYRNAWN